MRREMYLSMLYDRTSGGPVIVASPRGGTSIEDVAAKSPELVLRVPVRSLDSPIPLSDVERIVGFLGFSDRASPAAADALQKMYAMFVKTDATLIEVNPLAETPDARVLVCDAKINFDDNAAFRQADVFAMRDRAQEDPREVAAAEFDLNYIGLDGDIGCMVNGAGLAMATLDIINLYGGKPANFLDVGGGASSKQVAAAFTILNDDPNVRAVLVNIFGGIMRCDVIAHGMVAAAQEVGLRKPVVIRLQGTNVEAAKQVLEASGFRLILEDDLDQAAKKAVRVADIVRQAQEISVGVNFELPL
jgi:succinyl-CoA synthetase beta subunit